MANSCDLKVVERKKATRELYKYALSSVCAMWVFSVYTMVDGIFVARGVGVLPLAAVNISMPIINMSFGLSILMSVGASTRAAYWKGACEDKKANKAFSQGCFWVFTLAVVTSLFCYLFITPLSKALGADEQTIDYVRSYLSVLLLFDGCYMVSYYLEVLVKADGYPQKAIFYPLAGAVVNIGLDYIFIFKFGWGISGAAWATGLAQLTSLILFLRHFLSKKHRGFSFSKFKPSLIEAVNMGKVGFADAITEVSVGIVILVFNRRLLEIYGNDGIAVYTIISYLSQLILMTIVGLSQGLQPLLSYYWGKYLKDGGKGHGILILLFKKAMLIGIILSIGSFAICQMAAPALVEIFLSKECAHLSYVAMSALRVCSFSYLPLGITIVIYGSLVAFEKAGPAMSISLSRGMFFPVTFVYVLPIFFNLNGVWLSQVAAEWMTMFIALFLYNKKLKDKLHIDSSLSYGECSKN